MSGDTLVIIPAFNEQDALPSTIAALRAAQPDLAVVIVDDGSTDATSAVARSLGIDVVRLPFNLGIGAALQTGFRFAVAHGFTRAVQFDADGQHDPASIPALLAGLDAGADLVIGSRFADGGDTYEVGRMRSGAMGLLRLAVKPLSGQRFTDTSSGFRGFSHAMLVEFAERYPDEYLESVEALLLASTSGFAVTEVPVTMHERTAGLPSTRRLRLAYHYVRLLLVIAVTAPRRHHVPAPVPEAVAP